MAQLQSTGITGSLTVTTGSATELFVTNTGVRIGNVIGDTHTVTGSLNISGSLGTVGTITATTLIVQTITSSVATVTGSTKFGIVTSNTHEFTGSILQSGSLATFAGSVGIGTASPNQKLVVSGNASVTGVIYSDVLATYSGTSIDFRDQAAASIMYLDATNKRVGIGTTSPLVRLDVRGTAIITNPAGTSYDENLRLPEATSGYAALTLGGAIAASGTSAAQWTFVKYPTTNNFSIRNNNADLLYIKTDGNVGIGTTSPETKLHIAGGDVLISNGQYYSIESTTGGNYKVAGLTSGNIVVIGAIDYTSAGTIFAGGDNISITTGGAAGTSRMYINSNGNVGIGTTSPVGPLNIRHNGSGSSVTYSGLFIQNSSGAVGSNIAARIAFDADGSSTGYGFIEQRRDGTDSLYLVTKNSANGPIGFETSGSTRMYIVGNTGNVGIGTTAPLAKLVVNGTTWINQTSDYGGAPSKVQISAGSISDNVVIRTNDLYLYNYGSSYSNLLRFGNGSETWNIGATSGATPDFRLYELNGGSERLTIKAGGNVGIGTTNPTQKLHVVGDSYLAGLVYMGSGANSYVDGNSAAIGYKLFVWDGVSSYQQRITVNQFGNVGIGTTSPGAKLDIANGNIRMTNSTSPYGAGIFNTNNIYLADNQYLDIATGTYKAASTGTSNRLQIDYASGFLFYNSPSTTGGNTVTSNLAMVINTGGNVGIGTTNPTAKLRVDGTSNVIELRQSSIGSATYYVMDNTVETGGKRYRFGYSGASSDKGSFTIYNETDNITPLTILTGGNVGIGTTAPVYKLDVAGNIGMNGRSFAFNSATYTQITDPSGGIRLYLGNSNDPGNYYDNTSHSFRNIGGGTVYAVIVSSGNVGIGTTSPGYRLTVANVSTNASVNIGGGNSNSIPAISMQSDFVAWASSQNGFAYYYNATNGNLDLYRKDNSTTENQVMTWVRASGNVGIGTLTPSLAKLQVNGNVWATSFTGSFSGSIAAPGSNTNVIYNSSGVFAGSNNFVFNGTDVGIGTSSPSNYSGYSTLTIVGASNGGVIDFKTGGTHHGQVYNSTTAFHIYSISNIPIIVGTNSAERMRILSNGNIGIGTTSPGARLDVRYDDGVANGEHNVLAAFSRAGTGPLVIGYRADGTNVTSALIRIGDSLPLTIGTTSTNQAVIIQNDGNVGIGSTSPAYKLDINGSGLTARIAGGTSSNPNLTIQSAIYPMIDFTSDDSNAANRNWRIASVYNQYGMLEILSSTSAGGSPTTSRLAIKNDGNVGIGNTSPGYKLEVTGDINFSSTLKFGGVNVIHNSSADVYINGRVIYSNSTLNDGMYIGYNSTGGTSAHIRFFANGTNERMRIDAANGSVGIGTTSPAYKLDVVGAARLGESSTVIISNDATYGAGYGAVGFGGTSNGYNRIFGYNGTADGLFLASATGRGIWFRTNGSGTDRMVVASDGNVGIGTTSPTLATLQVVKAGAGQGDANGAIMARASDGDANWVSIGNFSTAGSSYGWIQASSLAAYKNLILNPTGGNVGIGTTAPASTLHVNGNTTIGYSTATAAPSNGLLVNGSVGIGLTAPTQKLSIRGNQVFTNQDVDSVANALIAEISSQARGYSNQGANMASIQFRTNSTAWYMGEIAFLTNNVDGTDPTKAATERMRIDRNGNVGIGTISPTARLHVSGTTGGIFEVDGASAVTALYVSASGNVGVYNTSPVYRLDVTGNGRFSDSLLVSTGVSTGDAFIEVGANRSGNGFAYLDLVGDTTYPDYGLRLIRGNGGANTTSELLHRGTGAFNIKAFEAATLTLSTSNSARLTILSGGNVGIGTTSPGGKLDILLGSANLTTYDYGLDLKLGGVGGFARAHRLYHTSVTSSTAFFGAYGDGTSGVQRGYWTIGNPTSIDVSGYNTTNGIFLLSGGSVGIGTTSPAYKLDVIGSIASNTGTNEAQVYVRNSTSAIYLFNSYAGNTFGLYDGTAGQHRIYYDRNSSFWAIYTGASERMRIDSSGNVGIATTSPQAKVHIGPLQGDTTPHLYIASSNNSYGWRIDTQDSGAGVVPLRIWRRTGGSDTQVITVNNADGNVGIGSTSPAYKLDVNGTIRATGDIIAYSDARVKDNIETITDALTKVTSLRGVSYTRKDNEDKSRKVGVIAQEVLEVLPEVVQQDTNGNYSVAYGNMVGVLIEAIKEQQRQIDDLKYLLSQK